MKGRKTRTDQPQILVCPEHGATFRTESGYNWHMDRFHKGQAPSIPITYKRGQGNSAIYVHQGFDIVTGQGRFQAILHLKANKNLVDSLYLEYHRVQIRSEIDECACHWRDTEGELPNTPENILREWLNQKKGNG